MKLGLEAGAKTRELAMELGIKGVPINAAELVLKGVEVILDDLNTNGLSVCQIGAFGFNPLHPDPEVLEHQGAILKETIGLAAKTGCPYIVICGGNYHASGFGADDPANHTEQALDRVAEVLRPYLLLAAEHGAVLSIEAYLKTAINSPKRFLALLDRLGDVPLVANVDVTSHYVYEDFLDPSETINRVCQGFVGHYGLGHIKDIALEEGFHIHAGLAPMGTSNTDWIEVLRLMAPHMADNSWLILEHVLSAEQARADVAHLRNYARQAGVELL